MKCELVELKRCDAFGEQVRGDSFFRELVIKPTRIVCNARDE